MVSRAEVAGTDANGATVKAVLADGVTAVVRVDAAGDGMIRVRLAEDPQARSRSARLMPLVHPARTRPP
ncbi:hypothetical protein GCM10029963_09890 [Micromonospora andamanensis]